MHSLPGFLNDNTIVIVFKKASELRHYLRLAPKFPSPSLSNSCHAGYKGHFPDDYVMNGERSMIVL